MHQIDIWEIYPLFGVIKDTGPPSQGDTYHKCVVHIKLVLCAKFCPSIPKMLQAP